MNRRLASLSVAAALMGCDPGTVTNDTNGMDTGGADVGEVEGCDGVPDGTACGTDLICVEGTCGASECGDGYLDEDGGELCDDGNGTAFDGCEPGTCTFTCDDAADCDDTLVCNGAETCSAEHVCALGAPADDGDACTLDEGGEGVCRTAACVAAGCGNGVTDTGEDCDDDNEVEGDGCNGDCTFSCSEDVDCSDGDACNGSETCVVADHACVAGTALDCDDDSPCTTDSCDPIEGECLSTLIDGDGDGHADEALGACGDDCDDDRADVYEGAEELCDSVDNNCNDDTDEIAPTWYIDCDDDGFAQNTSGSRTGCAEPPASATGCGGGWTNVRPINITTTDCNDSNDDVFPGQTRYFTTPISASAPAATRYDYDCSGGHTRQYTCAASGGGCGSGCASGYTPYNSSTNPNGCRFLCISGSCFVNEYPDCGEASDYLPCARTGSFCASSRASDRTQACR